ncbi:coatomer subunit epsilon [Brevipalpus obovatus]|uniref:coatomer subunit epsilon n=1 Tax=Brevipalpus obovatus TaxID=246614 RepID=UPI003D9DBC4A
MPEENLFEMRNAFFLGNFDACIKEAMKVKDSEEADIFKYRSYIAQKEYQVVLDAVSKSSSQNLLVLRHLATYLDQPGSREQIGQEVHSMASSIDMEDPFSYIKLIVSAMIHFYEDNIESSLKILYSSNHIECMALTLQLYLLLDRVDLAEKGLKKMQELDEEAIITQLAQAWVNINIGGDKLQEAYFIYQELCDKYGQTALLLNGTAVTLINQNKYDDVEDILQQAMDKDKNSPETLVNLIHVTYQLGKSLEITSRYLTKLRSSHTNHSYVKEYQAKDNEFDRLTRQYAMQYE